MKVYNKSQKYIEQANEYDWDNISETERAWAAGFFDGEGSTWANENSGNRKQVRMQVPQKNVEPLERFMKAVGWGKIYGPYRKKEFEIYVWRVYGEIKVSDILTKIGPYLSSIKFKQALDAMSSC